MDFNKPVKELFMVGPTYVRRLKKLKIETVADLLYHFPFRYLDYSLISPINRIQPGEIISIKGEIMSIKNQYTKYRKNIQKALIKDETGTIEAAWFNQPFLTRTLKKGNQVRLAGKAEWFGKKIVLVSPEYEVDKGTPIHAAGLVPIYHETRGVSSKWLRSRIMPLFKSKLAIKDIFPAKMRDKYNLMEINSALEQIHFPNDQDEVQKARSRFAFEELFLLQLASLKRKKDWQRKKPSQPFKINQEEVLKFISGLPFELTKAQKRVFKEIFADLSKKQAMNRLLEGDVGSGKTVVAAAAIFMAYLNGVQSALMAPTEILAYQHYQTLRQLLEPLGVKISLLTGAKKKIVSNFDLVIGTHALIYKAAQFKKLGLVVIDEQHRFGVKQRAKLINKGKAPHLLTMTATPIPRTIALTLYNDLDLSVLDEMPPGRQKIKTWIVPSQKREAAYQWIKKEIKTNHSQVFIVCPLIEESAHETMQSVKAATSEYQKLKKEAFSQLKLGLVHGRLKSKEKTAVLEKFQKKKIDILVATPVVEVGIDIPGASIMVIEAGERFGLAQLHQLRGRVGRGQQQAYCLIFSEKQSRKTYKRLKALEQNHHGMKLAEIDLELRGPGEIYGAQQHGFFELNVASFTDLPLIEKTRKAAETIIKKNLSSSLQQRLKTYTIKHIEPN